MIRKLESYFDRLWPINRSITGNGNRQTLKILSEIIDLKVDEILSGTKCFDWVIPDEWNVKEAWIKNSSGKIIVDFKNNNLHLLGYSVPFHGFMPLSKLEKHLFSMPDQPDVIPYLTSYYDKNWGFCLPHNQLQSLAKGHYEVLIDAELNPKGSMSIGEAILKGETDREILFSTYICHPSLANNELSGPLATAFIYSMLKKQKKRRYTYRFVFLPESIGSIYYLSVYGDYFKEKLVAGYIVNCLGTSRKYTYKKSRRGNTLTDRAAELMLKELEENYLIEDFSPTGSDEKHYCSPGFNLPVGSLMTDKYATYEEYHTSADNKSFISFEALEKSINRYLEIIYILKNNYTYRNLMPYGEPQLGKRHLFPSIGSQKNKDGFFVALKWVLNYSDGTNDLIQIAHRSGISYSLLVNAATQLLVSGLLEIVE
jgi:aminopeptidase-like protein